MAKEFLTDTVIFKDGVAIDANGILRGVARLARIGVQEYVIDNQLKKVLRPVDEVMKSADSFSNQVATLNHPNDGAMVNSTNAKELQVGFSGDVTYLTDEGWLEGLITITVDKAVTAARTTHRQFSNGYFADLVEQSGKWVDELGVQGDVGVEYDYDLIQTNIDGNHIALVIAARAGDNATFKDEGTDPSKCFTIIKDEQILNKPMGTIQITDHQGVAISLDENQSNQRILDYITHLTTQLATVDKDLVASQTLVEKQVAQIDELNQAKDGLTEAVNELKAQGIQPDFAEATITERVELWGYYKDSGCDVAFIDHKLPAVEIQKLVLSQKIPNFDSKFPSISDAEVSVIWKMKDTLIPDTDPDMEEEDKEPDDINDGIYRKVVDSTKNHQPKNTEKDLIADAQQTSAKRRQSAPFVNM